MRKHILLALSLLGLFDALYLLWVYTSPSRPIVCLGTGCDTVRASSYAHPFGVPMPVFGVAAYVALALLILAEDLYSESLGRLLRYGVAGISGFGFVVFIYLTSLEAFVIHAYCAWCVVSALVMTCIFVLSILELPRPNAPADAEAAIASVRTNFVLGIVALLVGVPAFLWLSGHGEVEAATDVSSEALAEHLVRPDSHMAGNLSAPLTVVEFGDFSCPGCGFSEEAAAQVRAQYGGRLRFVFRQFPLGRLHPQSEKAAEASECAAEQGKFWEAVDKFYAKQSDLSVDALKRYAGELGLDQARFDQCLASGETKARIKRDLADGHALGVKGTPTFFIGGKMLFRPLDFPTFSLLVNQALVSAGAPTAGAPNTAQNGQASSSPSTSKPPSTTPGGGAVPEANAGSMGGFGSNPAADFAGSQSPIGACSEAEANKKQPALIRTAEARRLLDAAPGPVVVDVRPSEEFATGRIPGALNMPVDDFAQDMSKLPKDKTIVLYESGRSAGDDICAASRAAGRALLEHGFSFERVKVYQDGLAGWQKAGQPVQR